MRSAIASQPYWPAPRLRRGGHARQPGGVAEQRAQRAGERFGVARRHELAARRGDLREAADARQQQRLAERQRGEQHAGLVDLAVGQHDQVGRAEGARELGAGHEAQRRADAGAVDERRRPCAASRRPTARRPRSARAPRVEQDVDALVGPEQPEEQHHGLSVLANGGVASSAVEVVERAVRDHVHASRGRARARRAAARRRARSARRSRPSARRARAGRRAGPASARAGARRARSARAVRGRGSRRASSAWTDSHWKCTTSALPRGAAVAQHVRHVLRQPRVAAAARRRPAVEGLAHVARRARAARRRSENALVNSETSAPARTSAEASARS